MLYYVPLICLLILYSLLVMLGANFNVETCDGLSADDLGRSLGSKVGINNLVLQSDTNNTCFIMLTMSLNAIVF